MVGRTALGSAVDGWAVLGLSTSATRAQAKAAYRQLARATHPDLGGDARRFAVVHDAYGEVMSQISSRTSWRSPHEQRLRGRYGLDDLGPRVVDVRL
ncbi:MAG: J domain-containing protein [Gaiella sp.]